MFTIIIKDTSNQEIFRKSLDPSVPETPSGNKYWWNLDVLSIDKKIRPPFNVFVVDKLQDSPFKFSVTPK